MADSVFGQDAIAFTKVRLLVASFTPQTRYANARFAAALRFGFLPEIVAG
jgi:hypothetical protein